MGMMTLNRQLSNKIRILREINNYTQKYVANILEISQNTYSMIERGETRLTMERLEKLASLYNVNLSELLETDKPTPTQTITNTQTFADNNKPRNPVTDEERKAFLEIIRTLEKENERLHALIDKLTQKLSY